MHKSFLIIAASCETIAHMHVLHHLFANNQWTIKFRCHTHHTHTHTHTNARIHTHTHIQAHAHTHTHTNTHKHRYTQIQTPTHSNSHKHTHLYNYASKLSNNTFSKRSLRGPGAVKLWLLHSTSTRSIRKAEEMSDRDREKNCFIFAFVTWNSNIVLLLQGPRSSNPCRSESSGFCVRSDDLRIDSPALWPTELDWHHLGC